MSFLDNDGRRRSSRAAGRAPSIAPDPDPDPPIHQVPEGPDQDDTASSAVTTIYDDDDHGPGQQPPDDDISYASRSSRSVAHLPPPAVEVHHPRPPSMASTEPSSGYQGSLS